MATKKKIDSLIGVELEKFEKKLNEFQKYLLDNTLNSDVLELDESNKHKEIDTQIKIMHAVLNWLPVLEKLREDKDVKKVDIRAGAEVNGMFKTLLDGNNKTQ